MMRRVSSPTNPPTPHMSASLGFGWILLLLGIGLGIYGMWRKVAVSTVILIALLIILRCAWHPAYSFLIDWILTSPSGIIDLSLPPMSGIALHARHSSPGEC
jgi:hypothetical protein